MEAQKSFFLNPFFLLHCVIPILWGGALALLNQILPWSLSQPFCLCTRARGFALYKCSFSPPRPSLPPGAASTPLYVHSPVGLFPSPLGPSASYPKVEEICSKFKFLGKFIAKAVMDSRMVGFVGRWSSVVPHPPSPTTAGRTIE